MKISCAVLAALGMVPAAWGGMIDFEGAAPCAFANASALTNEYLGLGIVFSSQSAPGNGGAILGQCGGFGINAHSGTNMLAFNTGATLSGGGIPTGPELFLFGANATSVSLWVGATLTLPMYTFAAYDSGFNLVDTVSAAPGFGVWTQLTVNAADIEFAYLTMSTAVGVVDDLTWTSAPASNGVPEPSTAICLGAGLLLFAGVRRMLN